MAENAAETEDQTADTAFDAGFDTPPPEQGTVEKPKTEEVKPEEQAPVEVAAEAPAPKEPEYVQITRDEHGRFMAAADKTVQLEQLMSKSFGTFGNTLQNLRQAVEKVQSNTPTGAVIDLSDDDFAELAEEFPELAKLTKSAWEKMLARANVRGTGEATAATIDPDAIEKAVNSALEKKELARLNKDYPDWRDIVGAPLQPGQPAREEAAFRQWLKTQPEKYQREIDETDDPADVRDAISKFRASEKKPAAAKPPPKPPAPNGEARKAVLAGAIQPRGDGGLPGTGKPAIDPFDLGFTT